MLDIEAPSVDSARMRRAGRELLSLALMDSRNHTLRWIGAFEQALSTPELDVPQAKDLSPPLWELGHLGCCLLYTSEAAAERSSVDLGGGRII